MSGVAKTIDKAEQDSYEDTKKRKGLNPLTDQFASSGYLKKKYGEKHDIETSEGGYSAAKKKHESEEAAKKAADDQAAATAQAQAAQAAAAEAALQKSQESQKAALKRKGRRASILTSSQGAGDPLGVPGA